MKKVTIEQYTKKELNNFIIDLIIECLTTGKQLPSEKELAERFGVGRSALREILSAYEADGVIVAMRGSGRVAKLPDISSSIIGSWNILLRVRPALFLELLDVRSVLEKGFLKQAINTLDVRDLQMMRDLVDRMVAKADKNEVFIEEDREFHRILYSKTNNILLDQLLVAFWDLFDQMNALHQSTELKEGAQMHRRFFQLILTKDYEEASEFLDLHFGDIRKRIKLHIELEVNKEKAVDSAATKEKN